MLQVSGMQRARAATSRAAAARGCSPWDKLRIHRRLWESSCEALERENQVHAAAKEV